MREGEGERRGEATIGAICLQRLMTLRSSSIIHHEIMFEESGISRMARAIELT